MNVFPDVSGKRQILFYLRHPCFEQFAAGVILSVPPFLPALQPQYVSHFPPRKNIYHRHQHRFSSEKARKSPLLASGPVLQMQRSNPTRPPKSTVIRARNNPGKTNRREHTALSENHRNRNRSATAKNERARLSQKIASDMRSAQPFRKHQAGATRPNRSIHTGAGRTGTSHPICAPKHPPPAKREREPIIGSLSFRIVCGIAPEAPAASNYFLR